MSLVGTTEATGVPAKRDWAPETFATNWGGGGSVCVCNRNICKRNDKSLKGTL